MVTKQKAADAKYKEDKTEDVDISEADIDQINLRIGGEPVVNMYPVDRKDNIKTKKKTWTNEERSVNENGDPVLDEDEADDQLDKVEQFERPVVRINPVTGKVKSYDPSEYSEKEKEEATSLVLDQLITQSRRGGVLILDERRRLAIAYACAYALRSRSVEYTIKAIKVMAVIAGIALVAADIAATAGLVTTTALFAVPLVIPGGLQSVVKAIAQACGVAEKIRANVQKWELGKVREGLEDLKDLYGKEDGFDHELQSFLNMAIASTCENNKQKKQVGPAPI